MHDEISGAIDVSFSPHVPQATKDNAFCIDSAAFNSDDNFAAPSIDSLDECHQISPGIRGLLLIAVVAC